PKSSLCSPPPGANLVLVVDDEERIRQVVVRSLETIGLAAVEAADGRAGLDRFQERPAAFQLILLDLNMPGVGGDEVLRQVRRVDPGMPVIMMSGDPEEEVAGRVGGAVYSGFLQKPFRPAQLLALVKAQAQYSNGSSLDGV